MRSVIEIGANVPAFLAKLWKLVDDPETDHLISWSPGGKMFNIQNQAEFARELLPLYYKHNNMASFIRQLNMYGFHKVTSIENGGLKPERDEIEFSHPCFLQGHPYLLEHIKRKIAHPKPQIHNINDEKSLLKPELMNKMLVDVKQIKGKQESLDARFSVMKHENEALWREVALLRQKHMKQQQIVNNLIQFLMSLVQPSRSGSLKTGVKRRYQLMINNAAHNIQEADESPPKTSRLDQGSTADLFSEEECGPTIHEVADHEQISDTDSVRNILLCSDPNARISPGPSPSPTFSVKSSGQDLLTEDNIPLEYVSFDTLGDNLDALRENVIPVPEQEKAKSQGKSPSRPKTTVPVASIISPQPSLLLPSDIFEGEGESNSQDGSTISLNEVDRQAAMSALQNASEQIFLDSSEIDNNLDFVNTVTSGAYNPNVNLNSTATNTPSKGKKKKETKKQTDDNIIRNVKEEVLNPEEDWSLATVPTETRPQLHRFHSVEEVDDHLEAMQADLDSIKQILRGENYTFDANSLLSLFSNDEPLYNLPMNSSDLPLEKAKDTADDSSGQLITYAPTPLFDFDDMALDEADNLQDPSDDIPLSDSNDQSSTLNTPQMSMQAPDFSKKK